MACIYSFFLWSFNEQWYLILMWLTLSIISIIICLFLRIPGNSLAVQWLGLCTFTAGGTGLIPSGWGTKILHATRKKKKRMSLLPRFSQILFFKFKFFPLKKFVFILYGVDFYAWYWKGIQFLFLMNNCLSIIYWTGSPSFPCYKLCNFCHIPSFHKCMLLFLDFLVCSIG